MSFKIPNTPASPTVEQQAQSSPDGVDIDILVAGLGGLGVVSGCAVTAQGSPNMTLAVASGSTANGAVTSAVTGANVTITTADATNPRFDLVVATAGTLSVIAGTPGSTPTFPTIGASDVALAAVYVAAAVTSITSADLIDKRVILNASALQNALLAEKIAGWTVPKFSLDNFAIGHGPHRTTISAAIPASTTVASGSNTVNTSTFAGAGTLFAATTTGYATAGYVWVVFPSGSDWALVQYTSVTAGGTPSFNGCTITAVGGVNGGGALATGYVIHAATMAVTNPAIGRTSVAEPLMVDSEIVYPILGTQGTATLTIDRGRKGTTVASHASGATVLADKVRSVAFLGDSIDQASTGNFQAWADNLRDMLAAPMGGSLGYGFRPLWRCGGSTVSSVVSTNTASEWAFTGTVSQALATNYNLGPFGYTLMFNASAIATWTPPGNDVVAQVDVHWVDFTTNSTWSYSTDGGSTWTAGPAPQNPATPRYRVSTIVVNNPANFKLRADTLTEFVGIRVWNQIERFGSTTGVHFDNFGFDGNTLTSFVNARTIKVSMTAGSPNVTAISGTPFRTSTISDAGANARSSNVTGATTVLSVTDSSHIVLNANANQTGTFDLYIQGGIAGNGAFFSAFHGAAGSIVPNLVFAGTWSNDVCAGGSSNALTNLGPIGCGNVNAFNYALDTFHAAFAYADTVNIAVYEQGGNRLGTEFTITAGSVTADVATLTTSAPHGYSNGTQVLVRGPNADYCGLQTLTAVTSTTLSFALVGSTHGTMNSGTVVEVSTASGTQCGPSTQADYRAAVLTKAAANSKASWSFYDAWATRVGTGGYAAANSNGLMNDTFHPSDKGYTDIADGAQRGLTFWGPIGGPGVFTTIGTDPLWVARGDLAVGVAGSIGQRLAVGTFGQVPAADSAATGGLIFANPRPLDQAYLAAAGTYETLDRRYGAGNVAAPASGTVRLYAIALPKDLLVTNLTVVSGTVAAVSPTHWWFSLCNNAYTTLRSTADQTSTAWAASTIKTLALSSTFTTAYEGLYYLAVMQAAATLATSQGITLTTVLTGITPLIALTGITGQTTAPADGTNLATSPTAVTQSCYASVS